MEESMNSETNDTQKKDSMVANERALTFSSVSLKVTTQEAVIDIAQILAANQVLLTNMARKIEGLEAHISTLETMIAENKLKALSETPDIKTIAPPSPTLPTNNTNTSPSPCGETLPSASSPTNTSPSSASSPSIVTPPLSVSPPPPQYWRPAAQKLDETWLSKFSFFEKLFHPACMRRPEAEG